MSGNHRERRGETRAAVAELLAQGLSQAQIARRLDVLRPTVCFHLRNLGIEPNSALATRYDWARVRGFYDAGHSAAECRREVGFGVNAWADVVKRGAIVPRPRLEPLDQVLAAGRRRSRVHVKARLRMAGLKDGVCEVCGLTDWRGGNLQLLCPNCHSQTQSWGGRKNRRVSSET